MRLTRKHPKGKESRARKGGVIYHRLLSLSVVGLQLLLSSHMEGLTTQESPVTSLVHTIAANVRTDRAMETMRRAYSTDRWFTFPKFEETALYLKQRLEQSGLEDVEIGGGKADGETQVGFWTMPLAWDVSQARLEMIEPEHSLLCDYQSVPASLGMWSGPTPKDGVTAEIVDITRTPWADVKGKLVLTDKNSAGYKHRLVKYGALGAVNGFSENPALRDGRQWINAWGDNGWGFTKASTPLLSFSITPRQAEHIRKLLAEGKKVKAHAVVDSRYYVGRYPWVTGVLPGASGEEEVLVLGHSSEQGAQDNATGVSAMIEALNTIGRLIQEGKLSRPQRSIRILLMPELYGSLSYISGHPDRIKKTVAAMTVDTPAAPYNLAGTEYTFYLNPQVAMSYTDALIQRIAKVYFTSRPWHWKENEPGTDSFLGDPTIGVPDVWSYSGVGIETHHNSEDKPDTVDSRSLHDLITVLASYLYFNANAGEAQAPWLADITVDHVYQEMAATASTALDALRSGNTAAGSYGLDRISYLRDRGDDALLSVLRLVPGSRRDELRQSLAPELKQLQAACDWQSARLRSAGAIAERQPVNHDAEQMIVHRKRPGTLPLDDLSQDQWEGYPSGAWNKLVTVALYWCDGKRNLEQVIHLTKMEMGPSDFDFVGYFRFLQRHGYVDITK